MWMGSSEQGRGFVTQEPVAAARSQPEHPELLTSRWVTHEQSTNTDLRVKLFQFLYKNRAYFPTTFTHPQWDFEGVWGLEELSSCSKDTHQCGCRPETVWCHPLHQLKVCSTLNTVWECSNLSLCWAKSCVGSTRRPNCTLPVAQPVSDTVSSKHQQH